MTPINKPRRPRDNPNNPANLLLAERRNRAYNLRRAGLTYQQIADQIGPQYQLPNYSRQRAEEDVSAVRDGIVIQPAKDVLFEDLERVQALLTAVWTDAMKGDTKAVTTASRLLDQRAKYLGLYSPIRQVLTGPDGGPIQVQDLSDPAAAYAAALEAVDALLPSDEQQLGT